MIRTGAPNAVTIDVETLLTTIHPACRQLETRLPARPPGPHHVGLAMEIDMQWFVVLAGAHWRQLSPVIFLPHARVEDWSQMWCDSIDTNGALVELRTSDNLILVPPEAVIAAVQFGARRAAMGFVSEDPSGVEADRD